MGRKSKLFESHDIIIMIQKSHRHPSDFPADAAVVRMVWYAGWLEIYKAIFLV